ncbi:hypothetical protein [Nostoc sp. DedQUE09]|uniref:hypothetical protein n=1 Tax=Nostoc sp. DedQUE09 TaxID=3075394 RepID=UPI002AD44ED1|nr:hypothetical protein [Nostoc sp. DedQUE09]MDZ7955631.1 hypothetical protein [Nostoc sp. DedQUE09]
MSNQISFCLQSLHFWVQDGIEKLIESGTVEQVFNHPQHPLTVAYVTGARG